MRIAVDSHDVFCAHDTVRTYVDELLPQLVARLSGDDRLLLCASLPQELPAYVARLGRHEGFENGRTPFAGRLEPLWRWIGLPSFERVRGLEPLDVAHSTRPPLLPSRARRRLVTIHRASDDDRLVRRTVRAADRVIVPSQRLRELLVERHGAAEETVVVIPPGVHERYTSPPKPADVEALCAHFPFLEEPYLLALGGAAEPRRSVPFLLDAYARARREQREVPALVLLAPAGRSLEITEQLRARDDEGEVYVLEGLEREALPALYRGAELLLEPCLDEGFGQAALEASACGVPCLTGPSCGALELLGEAPIVAEANKENWARALVDLHGDPADRLRRATVGRQRAGGRSWEDVAREHWSLYCGEQP